jgi:hypothetical protein
MVHFAAQNTHREAGRTVLARPAPDMIARLLDVLTSGARHPLGVAGIMIESEIAAGRTPIQPGYEGRFSFSATDWHFPAVVSFDGEEVRLIAILANTPGRGALRRLVAAITQAGLRPVIVEPVGPTMPAILARWGWGRKIKGVGEERLEEWRPKATATGKAGLAGYEAAASGVVNPKNPSPEKQGEGL